MPWRPGKAQESLQALVGKDAFISQHLTKSEIDRLFRSEVLSATCRSRFFGECSAAGDTPGRKESDDSSSSWPHGIRGVVARRVGDGVFVAAADREKLLSEPGVYGTFAAFSLDEDWGKQDQATRIAQSDSIEEAWSSSIGRRSRSISILCAGFPIMPI